MLGYRYTPAAPFAFHPVSMNIHNGGFYGLET